MSWHAFKSWHRHKSGSHTAWWLWGWLVIVRVERAPHWKGLFPPR